MGETRSPKTSNWTQKVAVDLKSWLRVPMRETAKFQHFVSAWDHFDVFCPIWVIFCCIWHKICNFWSKIVSLSVDCNAPYGLMVICYWITQSHPRLFRKHRELVAFDRFCVPKNDPKVTRKWPKSGQFSGWITGNWLRSRKEVRWGGVNFHGILLIHSWYRDIGKTVRQQRIHGSVRD